ncbi:hypothetical protein [Lentzea jiangxiensis]|uniref:Excreted virulence factor EspC, type VII ESX diderm n=1 Tax=Lentzea jiangxiensis TaxID=641025 RepID=A0A1H0LHW9_9PSEU|nr:hypothetical protein [Lentzea jiangxiensis]SDO67818.1 Excreted virulence factor EspC, type VII ESX diderm [Lentzea jiangxiensis]
MSAMGEKFQVVPDELRACSGLLERQAEHFLTIREHAVTKGGDTSGFTGMLSLLDPVVTGVAQLYGETLEAANRKMNQDAEALVKSAAAYEKADRVGVCLIDTAGGGAEPPSWLERFLGVGG